jgi:hypothetical protein
MKAEMFEEVKLSAGSHSGREEGMCVMELVAFYAGEPHGDNPECACPVLGAYARRLNDCMPDDIRDRLLKPLVPLLAETRDRDKALKRGQFLAEWTGDPRAIDYSAYDAVTAARFAAHAAVTRARKDGWESAVSGLRRAIGLGAVAQREQRHASA